MNGASAELQRDITFKFTEISQFTTPRGLEKNVNGQTSIYWDEDGLIYIRNFTNSININFTINKVYKFDTNGNRIPTTINDTLALKNELPDITNY